MAVMEGHTRRRSQYGGRGDPTLFLGKKKYTHFVVQNTQHKNTPRIVGFPSV